MVDVRNRGAQTREVEGLARRAERDQPPPEPLVGNRERSMPRSGMDQFAPDLVGDDEQVVMLGDLGNGLHLVAVEDATGRIVRVAEEDHPRGAVDRRREPIGVDPPACGIERNIDSTPPTVSDRGPETGSRSA